VETDGTILQLFPNAKEPDHLLKAGQERIVPNVPLEAGATVGQGMDQLWVVAATEQWTPASGRPEGEFQRFRTKMGRRALTRKLRPTEPMAEEVVRYHVAAGSGKSGKE
jgi:hypothetical protein